MISKLFASAGYNAAVNEPLATTGVTSNVRVAEFNEVFEFSAETQLTQVFVGQ